MDQTVMFNKYVNHHITHYFDLRNQIDALEAEIANDTKKLICLKKHKPNQFIPNEPKTATITPTTYYKIPPVAHCHSKINKKFEATRQPLLGASLDNLTTFTPTLQIPAEFALFQFHFDRNFTFRNSTLAPRQTRRVGLFSTRAPHRPNPIGLSIGKICDSESALGLDLLNNTPILSVSEYVDAFDQPQSKGGWMQNDGVDGKLLPLHYDDGVKGSFGESFSRLKKVVNLEEFGEQVQFINENTLIDVKNFIVEQLERVPSLTRTHKRIDGDQTKVVAIGLFRVLYEIKGEEISVKKIYCSIDKETCLREAEIDPEMEVVKGWYDRFE